MAVDFSNVELLDGAVRERDSISEGKTGDKQGLVDGKQRLDELEGDWMRKRFSGSAEIGRAKVIMEI